MNQLVSGGLIIKLKVLSGYARSITFIGVSGLYYYV
jgi:hypothetical protein